MRRRDYAVMTVGVLGGIIALSSIIAGLLHWVERGIAFIGFLAGFILAMGVVHYYVFQDMMKKRGHRLLPRHIYGAFLFTVFLIGGSFMWGHPPNNAAALAVVGIVLGLISGVIWLRFLKRNLKDGVVDLGAMSNTFRIGSYAACLVLFYLMMTTRYETVVFWVTVIACISYSIYSSVETFFLEKKAGEPVRFSYPKGYLLWSALYAVALMVITMVFRK